MFEGAYTAIVTPFTKEGHVDYGKLERCIEDQIQGGVDGIVPVGTTGESPTLDHNEHRKVVEASVGFVRKRAKVIAGTGGNSTAEAVELTLHAKEVGADGTLQVTPYYNKPSQRGLLQHFAAVADIGLPVVLYNIPGRTSREITVETVVACSKHPNIVAIKEAAGDVDRVSQYRQECDLEILSGDDALTLPMMSVGAVGVISVAANVVPRAVADMVHLALSGTWTEALALHRRFYPLFSNLFIETNPIPVKAALAMMGKIEETYRLPLCSMNTDRKEILKNCLQSLDLIES